MNSTGQPKYSQDKITHKHERNQVPPAKVQNKEMLKKKVQVVTGCETLGVEFTRSEVDGDAGFEELGLDNEDWDETHLLVVNFSEADYRIGGKGINRGLTVFAGVNNGLNKKKFLEKF